jgi:hypothetical protein
MAKFQEQKSVHLPQNDINDALDFAALVKKII